MSLSWGAGAGGGGEGHPGRASVEPVWLRKRRASRGEQGPVASRVGQLRVIDIFHLSQRRRPGG